MAEDPRESRNGEQEASWAGRGLGELRQAVCWGPPPAPGPPKCSHSQPPETQTPWRHPFLQTPRASRRPAHTRPAPDRERLSAPLVSTWEPGASPDTREQASSLPDYTIRVPLRSALLLKLQPHQVRPHRCPGRQDCGSWPLPRRASLMQAPAVRPCCQNPSRAHSASERRCMLC